MRRLGNAFLALALLLLAAGAFLAFRGGSAAPSAAWLEARPGAAVALAVTVGFADGLNPCAITTLLLFVGALLVFAAQASSRAEPAGAGRVWPVALSYITGVFLLYFALGAGFLETSQLRVFGNTHLFTRIAGLLAVPLGLVMLAEGLLPGSPLRLAMPAGLHGLARRWGRRTTTGGAFVGGVLIGLCTIPCGGAMYLAVAGVIAALDSKSYGYALLTAYNVAFVAPLALIAAVAGSRQALTRLSRLHITHRGAVKGTLGALVIAIGLFALL